MALIFNYGLSKEFLAKSLFDHDIIIGIYS